MRLTEMEGADAEAQLILAKTKADYEKLAKDARKWDLTRRMKPTAPLRCSFSVFATAPCVAYLFDS